MASVAEGISIDIIVSQIQEPTCINGQYIDALIPELKLLTAKANISQDDLASILSISRQTYCAR